MKKQTTAYTIVSHSDPGAAICWKDSSYCLMLVNEHKHGACLFTYENALELIKILDNSNLEVCKILVYV